MTAKTAPSLEEIQAAQRRIAGIARVTPVYSSETFSRLTGRPVHLKAENLQRTGAFKIRGAVNRIALLTPEEHAAGVVTASAGNHGQAVAWAAREAGVLARIFMPHHTPMAKIEATRNYGAQTHLHGETFEEALAAALDHAESEDATFLHAFEDEQVIAGQGTIGLELLEQVPDLETVIIPIGGGGLASGIALAIRAVKPNARLVGVQTAAFAPLAGGEVGGFTIAEGIAVKHPGELTSSILRDVLDDIVVVTDEEISQAIVLLLERTKLVVEGAGAASVAALLVGSRRRKRSSRRRPLRREHRPDAAHLGHASRAVPLRPLPRPAHATSRPARRADQAPLARGRGDGERALGRAPPRGHGHAGDRERDRADADDARPGALRDPHGGAGGARATRSRGCNERAPRAQGRDGALRRPRRLHLARRVARPRGRRGDPRAVPRAVALPSSNATAARSRSSSATPSWRSSARRSRTRTIRSAPCARRSPSATGRDEEGELEVRIGITTGEALVSLDARPEAGQGMASGDVVNTAARLQAAAPVNGVLVDETTYRATSRRSSIDEADPVEAKGKREPVPVWEAARGAQRGFGVDVIEEARTRACRPGAGATAPRRHARAREERALGAAPDTGRRARDRQEPPGRRAVPDHLGQTPSSSRGARVARFRTAKA